MINMLLDPQLAAWFERLNRSFGALSDLSPASRRRRYEEITTLLPAPPAPGVTVREIVLPLSGRSLAARLYHPGGKAPLLVFYHGGGWVVGSCDTHHGMCLALAAQSGAAVASVEYRLAPEHPYPAPCDDAYDALVWLAAHAGELGCDPRRLAVGGDSAGAHLAAVAAISVRERGGPRLACQWLIYPVIAADFTSASYREFAAGPGLTRADMEWFWGQFLGDGLDCPDYRASPARAASLAGLPPAYVLVSELDPLRDEGMAYGAALEGAGVAARIVRAAGMTHGFARLPPVCAGAARYMDAAAAALKEGLA